MEEIFYDIINVTRIIFNTIFVILYGADIDVSIIPVDNGQGDSKSDPKNRSFWTPEAVALLMMVITGLCFVSSILFCVIVFCCRKRNMSMFEKNESVHQVYSVNINSSERSQSDV